MNAPKFAAGAAASDNRENIEATIAAMLETATPATRQAVIQRLLMEVSEEALPDLAALLCHAPFILTVARRS